MDLVMSSKVCLGSELDGGSMLDMVRSGFEGFDMVRPLRRRMHKYAED